MYKITVWFGKVVKLEHFPLIKLNQLTNHT